MGISCPSPLDRSGCKAGVRLSTHLNRLEITPSEIVFKSTSDTANLRVIAHWSDNTSEDVTAISRFRTNDDAVAKIDPTGKVSAAGVGDTHVVVFYDNGVAPVPVLMPVSDRINDRYPGVPTPTKTDELIVAKLRKLGIVPSDLANDEEFLRRVSLDITGTLPPPAEILAFSADNSPDKREKKIDELLERPAYAAWWATRLSDLTGNNPATMRQQLAPAPVEWYHWIQKRIANNTPYDQIVAGIVSATSRRADQSFEDFCKEMAGYYAAEKSGDFADRETMPHYWARQNFRTPDERVMGFAYSYMGIQIQCAQCHKHPFDQWSKDDFDQFKPFFARVRYGVAPGTKEESDKLLVALGVEPDPKKRKNNNQIQNDLRKLAAEGKVVPHQEVFVTRPNQPAQRPKGEKGRNREPAAQFGKLLGGEQLDLAKHDDPRTALVDWLRSDPRRFLARAFVNRVWANYFNVGIIQPTDDMNLANPPSNAALLDYLARRFRRTSVRHEVAAPRNLPQPSISAILAAERDEPARHAQLQPRGPAALARRGGLRRRRHGNSRRRRAGKASRQRQGPRHWPRQPKWLAARRQRRQCACRLCPHCLRSAGSCDQLRLRAVGRAQPVANDLSAERLRDSEFHRTRRRLAKGNRADALGKRRETQSEGRSGIVFQNGRRRRWRR